MFLIKLTERIVLAVLLERTFNLGEHNVVWAFNKSIQLCRFFIFSKNLNEHRIHDLQSVKITIGGTAEGENIPCSSPSRPHFHWHLIDRGVDVSDTSSDTLQAYHAPTCKGCVAAPL